MKLESKIEARIMRKNGKSLGVISKKLNVSKSTASQWTRDIVLTEDQKKELEDHRNWALGFKISAKNRRIEREAWRHEGRIQAQSKNWLHTAGCFLYWGEGRKCRNMTGLCNTDPNMLRFFVRFIKEAFGVSDNEIRISIRYYSSSGKNQEEIKSFWVNKLGLPVSCIKYIKMDCDNRPRTGKKKNRHLYGICDVQILRTEIQQKILGAIEEYGETIIEDKSSKKYGPVV